MSVNVYDSESKELTRIAGDTLYADAPIGAIIPYGAATAPSGWLLCQGQAISRTTYAALFKAIGTAFGAGDGSTTFNVPDLREATTKGVGLTSKSSNHYDSDGVALGEFVEDRFEDHVHVVSYSTTTGNGGGVARGGASPGTLYNSMEGYAKGRSGATTEVKAVGVNYIIKAVQVGVPQDIASGVESMLSTKSSHLYLHNVKFRLRTLSEFKEDNKYAYNVYDTKNINTATKYLIGVQRQGINSQWTDLWNSDISSLYIQEWYDEDLKEHSNKIMPVFISHQEQPFTSLYNILTLFNNGNVFCIPTDKDFQTSSKIKECYKGSNTFLIIRSYIVMQPNVDVRGVEWFDGSRPEYILHVNDNYIADFKDTVTVWS